MKRDYEGADEMRKGKLLNSNIVRVLGNMGAQDPIAISNCKMSIPDCVEKIDIALRRGTPSLLDTLDTLLEEFNAGTVVLPEEIKGKDTELHKEILKRVSEDRIQYVSFMQFRKRIERAKAVVRTGEESTFGCIMLESSGLE